MYRLRMVSLLAIGLTLAACAPPAPPTSTSAAPPSPRTPVASPVAKGAPTAVTAAPAKAAKSPAEAKAAAEAAVADFYRGKTIRIFVGFSPGGEFDTWSRLVARYLPQYMPGNPAAIVENKPGAGSVLAAKEVYAVAPKDGTVIASFHENIILQQAVGAEGIDFDTRRFQWLGSVSTSRTACAVHRDTGVTSIQELMGPNARELAFGTIPGVPSHHVPALLKEALGVNLKLVTGYGGSSDVRLAIERTEVDGGCWAWEGMSTVEGWFEDNGLARVITIMAEQVPDHPALKGVPTVSSLAETEEARQLIAALGTPSEIARPFAVAPEVPPDRVAALRQALGRLFADENFRRDAEKANLFMSYRSGEEVTTGVRKVLDTPAHVLAKLAEILQ